jgi:hypothetical protein
MPTTLFSLASREAGSEHWFDLMTGASWQQAAARLKHDGLDVETVSRWLTAAQASVKAHYSDDLAVRGDLFEYLQAGPRRESYKLVAVTVNAPSASTLRV